MEAPFEIDLPVEAENDPKFALRKNTVNLTTKAVVNAVHLSKVIEKNCTMESLPITFLVKLNNYCK